MISSLGTIMSRIHNRLFRITDEIDRLLKEERLTLDVEQKEAAFDRQQQSAELKAAAQASGLQIMVGCMLATSLAMAPAVLVAQGVKVVDLDGPLLLEEDRPDGLRFQGSLVHPPAPELWG